MKRRLFNFVALLSLLLCAATVAMWVRSYQVGERWAMRRDVTEGGTASLYRGTADSTRGAVEIVVESGHTSTGAPDESFNRHTRVKAYMPVFADVTDTAMNRLGFRLLNTDCHLIHGRYSPDGRSLLINFPYRWPALVLAMLPLRWAFLRSRRRPHVGRSHVSIA